MKHSYTFEHSFIYILYNPVSCMQKVINIIVRIPPYDSDIGIPVYAPAACDATADGDGRRGMEVATLQPL